MQLYLAENIDGTKTDPGQSFFTHPTSTRHRSANLVVSLGTIIHEIHPANNLEFLLF